MDLFQAARILIEHSVAANARLDAITFEPEGTHRGALSGRYRGLGKVGYFAEGNEFGEAGDHLIPPHLPNGGRDGYFRKRRTFCSFGIYQTQISLAPRIITS